MGYNYLNEEIIERKDWMKMFCPHCGNELIPESNFCAVCGSDVRNLHVVTPQRQAAPQRAAAPQRGPVSQAGPDLEQEAASDSEADLEWTIGTQWKTGCSEEDTEEELPPNPDFSYGADPDDDCPETAVVSIGSPYYLSEFQRIKNGGKGRFNWAAFFFGPAFCLYRKCWELFKNYFLVPLCLTAGGYLILRISTISFNLEAMIVGEIIAAVGGVWSFVNMIRLGANFNREYYEHCAAIDPGESEKCGTSVGMAILFYVIYFLFFYLTSVITKAILMDGYFY
jgi:hypothetical protein